MGVLLGLRGGESRMAKTWPRALVGVVVIVGIVYAITALESQGVEWISMASSVSIGEGLWVLFILILYVPLSGLLWRECARAYGFTDLRLVDACVQVSLALVGKYVPGKIWGLLIKHHSIKEESHARAAHVLLSEQAHLMLAGSLIAMPAIFFLWPYLLEFYDLGGWPTKVILVAALVSILMLVYVRLKYKRGWLKSNFISGRLLVLALLPWLVSCSAFTLLIYFLSENQVQHHLILVALLVPLAMIVSMAAFFVPAGIGVRESMITVLVTPIYGLEVAIASAVVFRLTAVARDLISGILASLLLSRAA